MLVIAMNRVGVWTDHDCGAGRFAAEELSAAEPGVGLAPLLLLFPLLLLLFPLPLLLFEPCELELLLELPVFPPLLQKSVYHCFIFCRSCELVQVSEHVFDVSDRNPPRRDDWQKHET